MAHSMRNSATQATRTSFLPLVAMMGAMVSLLACAAGDPPANEPATCAPSCRDGFVCMRGTCVSACNPQCDPGEVCTAGARCVPRDSAVSDDATGSEDRPDDSRDVAEADGGMDASPPVDRPSPADLPGDVKGEATTDADAGMDAHDAPLADGDPVDRVVTADGAPTDGGFDAAAEASSDVGFDGVACSAPSRLCGADCVDTQSSLLHCGSCGHVCADGEACIAGGCTSIQAPRLIAPLSTSALTGSLPAFRYELPAGVDGARIELCRDRACTDRVTTVTGTGSRATPDLPIPTGLYFWRAFGRSGATTGRTPSAVWEFTVDGNAPRSATHATFSDYDGDGNSDALIALQGPPGGAASGYLYLGGSRGIPMLPSQLISGVAALGAVPLPYAGGDLNRDGRADGVMGDPNRERSRGAILLYQGTPTGFATSVWNIIGGFDGANAVFGARVGAGDYNGDGYSDLAVGAFFVDNGTGRTHVLFGGSSGLSETPGISLIGPDGRDRYYGSSVAHGRDVNGDGFSDLLVGATGGTVAPGRFFIYHGSSMGVRATADRTISSSDPIGSGFGAVVHGAGDVDGDGYGDVVVTASRFSSSTGRVYIYRGTAGGVGALSATINGLEGTNGEFGAAVAAGSDFNADGYADLAVGAPGVEANTGRVYVFLGGAMGLSPAPAAMLRAGDAISGRLGEALASPGDVNGDGYPDLIVGAPAADGNTGAVFVYYGSSTGVSSMGVRLTSPGPAGHRFGVNVAHRCSMLEKGAAQT